MNIRVNGKDIDFKGLTVSDLVSHYNLKPENIAAEKNGEIVHREKYKNETLKEGDVIELVKFVGGG